MKTKILLTLLILSAGVQAITAQNISGVVTDAASGRPMAYVTVALDYSAKGTTTAEDGTFALENIPVGRHAVSASFIGYETAIVKEILVGSARETYLEIALTEKPIEMEAVMVRPRINKAEPLNAMATVGARVFSIEEASRYAGGMDDPARLATSFAGVVAEAANNNGISIHGNSPSLLQWRIEGVEVPNVNHFADITQAGGGFLSALSSNVVGNSDFFVGAMPAEYGNAVSGVLDMRLRNGNSRKHQHTFGFGVQGIDLASEGPLVRSDNSSYIVNYRYSTLGLVQQLIDSPEKMAFQDLNFKFNFPTRQAGTFSLWGVGLIDDISSVLQNPAEWKYPDDGLVSNAKLTSGVAGLSHKILFRNGKTSLHTSLAATLQRVGIDEDIYDLDKRGNPKSDMTSNTTNFILTSAVNHKFGARHTNKTGFTLTRIGYDMAFDYADVAGEPLQRYIDSDGGTDLLSAYTSSRVVIGRTVALTVGLTAQYFALNDKFSIEPRVGLKWQATPRSSVAIGYGLYSRMEKADAYFVEGTDNRELGFTKSHHLMLSYAFRISDDMNLRVEPYFQHLYDVPVSGAYSILNREMYYITESLTGDGLGRNYGVDITLEKYLSKGLYWMATASVYDSKYRDENGTWHDTRYNRTFAVNGLIGKEWMIRKRDVLGVNVKASLIGGQRHTPVDEAATLARPDKEVQYDESRMYSERFSPQVMGDFSISYKMNRRRVAHEFAVKTVNITDTKRYMGHKFNLHTGTIEPRMFATSMFNVSYKIEF